MQNGNTIKSVLTVLTCVLGMAGFSQQKDSARSVEDYPSFKIDNECKSKSERTGKPTVIKIGKAKLAGIKTVKELLEIIPEQCEVVCAFFSIKRQDDKVFDFLNIGNEMVYAQRLSEGKFILVDNLVSTCPGLHKANYKILIEE